MQLTFTEQVQTATIIVGVTKNVQPATVQAIEAFVPVRDFVKSGDIQTEAGTLTKIPVTHEIVKRIFFIGLGSGDVSTETIRNGFGSAAKALKESNVTIALHTFTNDTIDAQQAAYLAAEGLVLGGYRVPNYKTTSNAQDIDLEHVTMIGEEDEAIIESFTVGRIYAEAQNEARSLVNMPPNLLTATALADYAVDLANEFGLEVEVLTKAEITELGMGGILAVNQGSSEEERRARACRQRGNV